VEGQYLEMDGTDALAFRVRGDGRKYLASLRTDNWIVGSASHDVWQAFLFARCSQMDGSHACMHACMLSDVGCKTEGRSPYMQQPRV
jgi:NADH dehydrogenase [ubiquinone] 1 alpha subcomplex assembly factor 1